MSNLAESVLPGAAQPPAVIAAPVAGDAVVDAAAESSESDEPHKDGETDRDKDSQTDDAMLAALALTGLPVVPVIPQAQQGHSFRAEQDPDDADELLAALAPGSAKNTENLAVQLTSAQPATAGAQPPQASFQNLLPILPAAAQGSAADNLLAAKDADAQASSHDSSNLATGVPSHLQSLASHLQSSLDPVTPREIRAAVGTHAWTRQVGDELAWMMQQGHDAASLKLSPEHLGPMEVRISMQDSGATVWFGASHADTRNALEQALPKLREMFAAQGLALADAGVFKEAPRQHGRGPVFPSKGASDGSTTEVTATSRVASISARLLDTYA